MVLFLSSESILNVFQPLLWHPQRVLSSADHFFFFSKITSSLSMGLTETFSVLFTCHHGLTSSSSGSLVRDSTSILYYPSVESLYNTK